MTLKEAMQRIADGWAEAPPWAGGGPSPADLFIQSLKGEGKFQTFDPRAHGPSVIRICPPQSRDSLFALHRDTSLSLPSLVAGGRGVDMLTPTDIYATVLDPSEPAEWGLTAFTVPLAKNVSLADVSPGIDTVAEGIVTFDKGTGVLRIDVMRLPSDEGWRLISLKYGTLFHEKAVVAVKRQPREATTPDDPAADVMSGHLLRAWRSAAAKADAWQPTGLPWLVGNVFAKMQSLIVSDILPNARLRDDEFDWVLDHLQQTVDRRLDSIKQGVWDTFTH